MKISTVITTYNRRQSLERCLSSLVAQSFPASEYEIIVVVDGCTDDTVAFLRSFKPACKFRWIAQANQGQAAAQNAGIAAAEGDVIVFLDDDCICDPELLAAHAEAHARADRLVVSGIVRLHPDSPSGALRDIMAELRASQDAELQKQSADEGTCLDLMLAANTSVPREALTHLVFDTSYKRIHDVEAGVRLWAAGYRGEFAPRAVAHEIFTKSANAVLRDCRYQGKFEVVLTNSYPAFKPLTLIARIQEDGPLKRALLKLLCRHPAASESALKPAYLMANFLRFLPGFSWLAKRALGARARIAHLNGAMQEAGSWEQLEERFLKRTPVILHHNIGTPRPGEHPGLTTPVVEFEKQLRTLSAMGYQGVRPSQWLQWRNADGVLPRRPVMLVFDDAYAEACSDAFPILEQYGFGAACMVVTGHIGSTNRWDEEAGRPSFPLMGKSEILEWSKRGIEFGGHTRHHPELKNMSDECVEQEMAQCKEELAALLGKAPVCFAYPFGVVSPAARFFARKKFEIAFTMAPGFLHLRTDPHLAPRISFLPGETRFGMWCRLRLSKNPYEMLRNRWRRLMRNRGRRS